MEEATSSSMVDLFSSQNYFTVGLSVIIVLITILYIKLIPKKPAKSPPMEGRFLWPFMGVGKRFGTEPVKLLNECKKKYGDVFTLHVAGKCFTFLTDAELFQYFFNPAKGNSIRVKNKKPSGEEHKLAISFDHAVLEFISRVFGIPVNDFMSQHITMVNTMRAKLSPSTTLPFYTKEIASNLMDVFEKTTENNTNVMGYVWDPKGTDDLFKAITETLFWSTVKSLYDKKAFISNEQDACKSFQTIDSQFEIRASGYVPESWMKTFKGSKDFLLKMISSLSTNMDDTTPDNEKRMFQLLREALKDVVEDQSTIDHFGLAMLWASQANSLPSSLWTICYVCKEPAIYEKLQKEVDEVFANHLENPRDLTFEKLNLFPYVKACIYEGKNMIEYFHSNI